MSLKLQCLIRPQTSFDILDSDITILIDIIKAFDTVDFSKLSRTSFFTNSSFMHEE